MEEGHRAVAEYKMETKVLQIRAPTLVLAGSEDPIAFPRMTVLSESIEGSQSEVIDGGMLPMVDQLPEEFARVVVNFLDMN